MGSTDSYDIDLSGSGGTVTLTTDEFVAQEYDSGTITLYYDGPEVPGQDPQLVGRQRYYYAEGVGDPEGGQVNIDGGAEIDFNVPERFVEGSGVFSLFIGAENQPSLEASAHSVRGETPDPDEREAQVGSTHDLRLQLQEERQRRKEAVAELRAELDALEERVGEDVPDGGGEEVGTSEATQNVAVSLTRRVLNQVLNR
jgi:hypothetical protein